jgi:hypothetical protein
MWFKMTTPATPSVGRIAYILVVIGGILLIILGLLSLIGWSLGFGGPFFRWGWGYGYFEYSGIVAIICGAIALYGSRAVTNLTWAIILLILGIVGGGIGGLLVILGAILGLLTILLKQK